MPAAHELLSDTVVEMDGGGRGVLEVDSGCKGQGPAGAHMGQLGSMSCNHWTTGLAGREHPEVGGQARWRREGRRRKKRKMGNTRVRPTKPGAGMKRSASWRIGSPCLKKMTNSTLAF